MISTKPIKYLVKLSTPKKNDKGINDPSTVETISGIENADSPPILTFVTTFVPANPVTGAGGGVSCVKKGKRTIDTTLKRSNFIFSYERPNKCPNEESFLKFGTT